ncbi:MAG: hypothetical protein ACFFCS_11205 [Candidatus Hodarchaeota archaeon]
MITYRFTYTCNSCGKRVKKERDPGICKACDTILYYCKTCRRASREFCIPCASSFSAREKARFTNIRNLGKLVFVLGIIAPLVIFCALVNLVHLHGIVGDSLLTFSCIALAFILCAVSKIVIPKMKDTMSSKVMGRFNLKEAGALEVLKEQAKWLGEGGWINGMLLLTTSLLQFFDGEKIMEFSRDEITGATPGPAENTFLLSFKDGTEQQFQVQDPGAWIGKINVV